MTSILNAAVGYQQYSFSGLVATSTSTQLKFVVRNDPVFSGLDDLFVDATPVVDATPAAVPERATWIFTTAGLSTMVLRRRGLGRSRA